MSELNEFFSLEFYNELPVFWQIVFGLFAFFLGSFNILLIIRKSFRVLIGNGLKKMFHYFNEKDLLMHALFYNKKYYLNQLNNINFDSDIKTKLFRLLLTEVIKASIELPYKFLSETKLKKLSPQEVRNDLNDLIYRIIKKYEQETRTRFIEQYGREIGLKLFGLIYDSNDGFRNYHRARLDFIFENIDRVMFSATKTLFDSVRTILTQIDVSTDLAIIDCDLAFKELNGRIEDLINK